MTGNDNGDGAGEKEESLPSHNDDFQALDLDIAWIERQEKCDPVQLLQVK